MFVTKNRCVTHVKIRGYANLVSSLLAYLISAVASWFSNSILSRSRMLLQIVCIVILLYLVQPESSRTFCRKVYKRIVVIFKKEKREKSEGFFQECLLKCDRGRV